MSRPGGSIGFYIIDICHGLGARAGSAGSIPLPRPNWETALFLLFPPALHRRQNRTDGVPQSRQVVAAFEQEHDPRSRETIGEREQPFCHCAEALFGDPHAAEGIAPVRIEAGGNENPLRLKFLHGRIDDILKHLEVFRIRAAGGQWYVDRETLARRRRRFR